MSKKLKPPKVAKVIAIANQKGGTGKTTTAVSMTQLIKTINKVKHQINPALRVDGVLLTLAGLRTNFARATADSLKENYGKMVRVYQNVIPVAVKAAETSAVGKSIYRYDKNSPAAKAYEAFTREVLENGQKQRHKTESSLSRWPVPYTGAKR